MKEECKLCSVNGWCGSAQGTTDFSISSLMRPAVHNPGQMDPRHDAVLLSAYLFKLGDYPLYTLHDYYSSVGYYQPAGPLIKESSADAERALTRYHPTPHYHTPHPSMLHQYGTPYYPTDLCYGRYYRPQGPYHMTPPQPEPQMVGVGSEPYPQYYGTPPCYQHSPQRIPYVEYRGCPCPLNACPKNVHIGPVTGKAPTGGGPVDVPSALAPPGGAFRAKVRACVLDSAADTHGSGKDPPPIEPRPPASADAPHPCPLPTIGGASPKRELFDRDNLRLANNVPGPVEALGPPSPARGSAGVCAPQPPPTAPRRARLGKAMARRSLAGDDTGLLLAAPQPPLLQHSDVDDDVLAISPPICAPIDLSSSDERSTPLVDVKKENEGPTYTIPRKVDAQALKEHNPSTTIPELPENTDAAKAVKRRHSKSKLEIEMKDVQLEDVCKTNGIGEHVKLQKRRKVSGEQTEVTRTETLTKEPRKKSVHSTKRSPRTPNIEKKANKRKAEAAENGPKVKKILMETITDEEQHLKNKIAIPDDAIVTKPKIKSALLLDNLIRKNSIDRADAKGYASDTEINPANLFLPTTVNCVKKTLNINNNVVENNASINGVQPNTLVAVSQHLEKKLAIKNACKVEKVDSKIIHRLKSVLKSTESTNFKEELDFKVVINESPLKDNSNIFVEESDIKTIDVNKDKSDKNNCNITDINNICMVSEDVLKPVKKTVKPKPMLNTMEEAKVSSIETLEESQCIQNKRIESEESTNKESPKKVEDIIPEVTKCDALNKTKVADNTGECKGKNVDKLVKLLVSQNQIKTTEIEPTKTKDLEESQSSLSSLPETVEKDNTRVEKTVSKRCKLSEKPGEVKGKSVEKVAKLLVSKKTVLKTNEASLVVEDACATPPPSSGRNTKRRRSGGRRVRRVAAPLTPPALQPRTQPRWSNGWNWDGEHHISKVYLNNDSRLDRTARCWSRMTHASGDRVARGDCVLLRASQARAQPFVARIASLWENPDDGEMMVSLVWYYRPEHTQRGRQAEDALDEVFASRHRDANSVACIEDKCYVLTFNEYCRYRKRLKAAEEGIQIAPSIVPALPASEVTPALAPNDTKLPPQVSPDLVLFCRKIYDFRSKKIQVPNK